MTTTSAIKPSSCKDKKNPENKYDRITDGDCRRLGYSSHTSAFSFANFFLFRFCLFLVRFHFLPALNEAWKQIYIYVLFPLFFFRQSNNKKIVVTQIVQCYIYIGRTGGKKKERKLGDKERAYTRRKRDHRKHIHINRMKRMEKKKETENIHGTWRGWNGSSWCVNWYTQTQRERTEVLEKIETLYRIEKPPESDVDCRRYTIRIQGGKKNSHN